MAHKTFISYKYSEAQELRDRIIKAFGDDASYYQGETSASPDLTDTSTENMTAALSRMIDTDMAEEMTEYTSQNVLVQAATSILSQANARPETVLQLLQR